MSKNFLYVKFVDDVRAYSKVLDLQLKNKTIDVETARSHFYSKIKSFIENLKPEFESITTEKTQEYLRTKSINNGTSETQLLNAVCKGVDNITTVDYELYDLVYKIFGDTISYRVRGDFTSMDLIWNTKKTDFVMLKMGLGKLLFEVGLYSNRFNNQITIWYNKCMKDIQINVELTEPSNKLPLEVMCNSDGKSRIYWCRICSYHYDGCKGMCC